MRLIPDRWFAVEVSETTLGTVIAASVAAVGVVGGALIGKLRTPETPSEIADDVVNRALKLVQTLQLDNDRLREAQLETEERLHLQQVENDRLRELLSIEDRPGKDAPPVG